MLVRTGKVKLTDLERAEILTGIPTEQLAEPESPIRSEKTEPESLPSQPEPEEGKDEEEEDNSEAKDTVGELPQSLSPKSPKSPTSPPEKVFPPVEKKDEEITPAIEKFLKTVNKLEKEVHPLAQWSKNFRLVFSGE